MTTIETKARVTADHMLNLSVQLPTEIPPGEHRVVVMIDGAESTTELPPELKDWPVYDLGPWPENLSLRREDMYGDFGR